MDNDERKNLDVLLKLFEQIILKLTRFTQYMIGIFILLIVCSSLLIGFIVHESEETKRECTRLYFETDYFYPEPEMSQTIGDVTNEATQTTENTKNAKASETKEGE